MSMKLNVAAEMEAAMTSMMNPTSSGSLTGVLKRMMERVNLKHRPNFIDNYLTPAINEGCIRLLYPDKPRHPRQKYFLTVKGLALYKELTNT